MPRRTPLLRERALTEARSLLGLVEQGGNNTGPGVLAIIRANGGTGPEPWCGDFVAFCYRKAGSKCVTRLWAAVRYLGRIAGMGIRLIPRPGDIVVFVFEHTGLVLYFCDAHGNRVPRRKATHVKTIEGNTGTGNAESDSRIGRDGVRIRIRALNLVDRFVGVYR